MNGDTPAVVTVLNETTQSHDLRKPLYVKLEEQFDNRCVLFYGVTMYSDSAMIDDTDADIIEGILQKEDLSNGLLMIINAPGGDGLAAERIVNVCCAYSNGNFEVAIPKMAKSAATMICLGAKRIHMSQTSELGPIDPQLIRDGRVTSVHSILVSYKQLIEDAVNTTGNVAPYLQLLSIYDPSAIAELQKTHDLSESIAVSALANGMLKGKSDIEIKEAIKVFTDANVTSSHGRRIGIDRARECGLSIEEMPLISAKWELLWDLYCRSDWCLRTHSSKMVETKNHGFVGRL